MCAVQATAGLLPLSLFKCCFAALSCFVCNLQFVGQVAANDMAILKLRVTNTKHKHFHVPR